MISYVPLSRLLANIPTTSDGDDPFHLRVLRSVEILSHARRAIQKEAFPMTYSLGKAVGALVYALGIQPKHFESGVSHNTPKNQRAVSILTPSYADLELSSRLQVLQGRRWQEKRPLVQQYRFQEWGSTGFPS